MAVVEWWVGMGAWMVWGEVGRGGVLREEEGEVIGK